MAYVRRRLPSLDTPHCSPSALGDAKGTPTAVSEPSEARNALPLQPQRHLRSQGRGPYPMGGRGGAVGRRAPEHIYIYIYIYIGSINML